MTQVSPEDRAEGLAAIGEFQLLMSNQVIQEYCALHSQVACGLIDSENAKARYLEIRKKAEFCQALRVAIRRLAN